MSLGFNDLAVEWVPMTPTHPSQESLSCLFAIFTVGGEGGIRTHVPVTRQDAFEAPPTTTSVPLRFRTETDRSLYRGSPSARTAAAPSANARRTSAPAP